MSYLLTIIFFNCLLLRETSGLSLFNLITFANAECSSADPQARCGTCYSSGDCNDRGGRPSGSCASGFGVCCLFIEDTCGSSVSRNNSYFRNPGFPQNFTITAPTTCSFRIERCQSNICSVRLDFDILSVADSPFGRCEDPDEDDQIVVISPSGFRPSGQGGICGIGLSGQHMYVDTNAMGSVFFNVNARISSTTNRAWNIKVIQIACDDMHRPRQGCAQYFTGPSGSIKSYNYDGGQILDGQIYSNCIRQEEGYCKINFFAVGDEDFILDAGIRAKSQDNDDDDDCDNDTVQIPGVIDSEGHGFFCGGKFNTGSEQTVHGVVTSTAVPFQLDLRTDRFSGNAGLRGFNLMYSQVPC